MSPHDALQSPVVLFYLGLTFGLLLLAGLLLAVLRLRSGPAWQSYRGWLVMVLGSTAPRRERSTRCSISRAYPKVPEATRMGDGRRSGPSWTLKSIAGPLALTDFVQAVVQTKSYSLECIVS